MKIRRFNNINLLNVAFECLRNLLRDRMFQNSKLGLESGYPD
jgi:hypothetical protein